jgi:hypothetical protein
MVKNQTGLTNRPLFKRERPGDERLTQERIDSYLARGRYLHSEFSVLLLAALWQKLKIGFLRTMRSFKIAASKLQGLEQQYSWIRKKL